MTTVTAGAAHTCALTTLGGVQCWGYNASGQVGAGTTTFDYSAPVAVPGLTSGVSAVSASDNPAQDLDHTCILTKSGGVQCWGYNAARGQLGNGSTTSSALRPVGVTGLRVAGVTRHLGRRDAHVRARMAGGTVECWGAYNSMVPVPVTGLTNR